jgi:hypothetical protein
VEEEDKYGDAQQRRSYRDAMERLGEDVVRMRLANRMSITDRAEDNPPLPLQMSGSTKRARARMKAETRRNGTVIVIAVISAVAAVIAAIPVVKSWLG